MKKILFLLLFNLLIAKTHIITVASIGVGVAPNDKNPSLAKAFARRAAVIDAYKELAAKLYGIRIKSKDTIKNFQLQDSTIRSEINGIVREANIKDIYFYNGEYRVKAEVKIDICKWFNDIKNCK